MRWSSPHCEITDSLSDKYLVYNIIEGGHQQRHDAGNGESQHQLSYGLFRHILVCILIHFTYKREEQKHLYAFCSSRITFHYLRFTDNFQDPIPYNLTGPPSYPDVSAQRIH